MKTLNMNEIDMVSGGNAWSGAVWGTLSLICSAGLATALRNDSIIHGNTLTALVVMGLTAAGTYYGTNLPEDNTHKA